MVVLLEIILITLRSIQILSGNRRNMVYGMLLSQQAGLLLNIRIRKRGLKIACFIMVW